MCVYWPVIVILIIDSVSREVRKILLFVIPGSGPRSDWSEDLYRGV